VTKTDNQQIVYWTRDDVTLENSYDQMSRLSQENGARAIVERSNMAFDY